jgi:hypothetical protein
MAHENDPAYLCRYRVVAAVACILIDSSLTSIIPAAFLHLNPPVNLARVD